MIEVIDKFNSTEVDTHCKTYVFFIDKATYSEVHFNSLKSSLESVLMQVRDLDIIKGHRTIGSTNSSSVKYCIFFGKRENWQGMPMSVHDKTIHALVVSFKDSGALGSADLSFDGQLKRTASEGRSLSSKVCKLVENSLREASRKLDSEAV